MRRILRLLAIVLALLLITVAWFWWNRPRRVDMAAYVPADSMVYLEANSLTDIMHAIVETDAWRSLAPALAVKPGRSRDRWLESIARITGIGSTLSVMATRAQVAFVMLDLNANGNGDTLELKPLAALVVETHTANARIKPVIERLIGEFAQRAYGQPTIERGTLDGNEFVKWIAPDGRRRIVVSIDGTVAIVANNEQAVSTCLAVRHGQKTSLLSESEIQSMRARLGTGDALAFGYASSANAARLFSVGAPILFGKLPNDLQFQKLLAISAAKIIGNVGWSVHSYSGGIEDRYFVSLKPAVVALIRSGFTSATDDRDKVWKLLPADTWSLTSYNLSDPGGAWASLSAAASTQLDALSAFVVTSGFKTLLMPYGIDDPDNFLRAVKPPILTARLTDNSERRIVVAGIADANSLKQFVSRRFGPNPHIEDVGKNQLIMSEDQQFGASFVNDLFLLGTPEDLRRCLQEQPGQTLTSSLNTITHYSSTPDASNIVTYANDSDRVHALIGALRAIRGSSPSPVVSEPIESSFKDLPYAVTETTLGADGFEGRTRSPLGQFGRILSLLAPEQPH
jgi:hypothetical protein